MGRLRPFAIGFGASVVLAAIAVLGFALYDSTRPSPAALATARSQPTSAAVSPSEAARPAEVLAEWQASGVRADTLKTQIVDLAVANFARETGYDQQKLSQRIAFLPASDYAAKSASSCDDASDVHSATEAWLLNIVDDKLYVNDGFSGGPKQTPADLFYRYTIGLFNAAPELKSYPGGAKSADGTTAYYEKGLILLGRRNQLDQLVNSSCYLAYRVPLQQAFTADRASVLLSRLGFSPSAGYDYPQKKSLEAYRASIAPKLGSAGDDLLDPFLKTDSGEFYRRVGKALGATDPAAAQNTADRLFRSVFPAS